MNVLHAGDTVLADYEVTPEPVVCDVGPTKARRVKAIAATLNGELRPDRVVHLTVGGSARIQTDAWVIDHLEQVPAASYGVHHRDPREVVEVEMVNPSQNLIADVLLEVDTYNEIASIQMVHTMVHEQTLV